MISSAAAALHGAETGAVRDVDLLMSVADGARLLERLGLPPALGPEDARFRSEVFGVWRSPPLPVEVMAGFRIATPAGWAEVVPETREAIGLDGSMIYVPSAAELARLFRRFGRPKDLARAEALDALSAAATPRG